MQIKNDQPGIPGNSPTPEARPVQPAGLRNLLISVPLLFGSLLPYAALAQQLGVALQSKLMLLGALGWWLALLLRLPIILLVKKQQPIQGQRAIILASGPTEELVRLGLLLWLGLNLDTAFSLALGWAGIEIVYAVIQGFALVNLARRQDKKAQEARRMLRLQGMDQALHANAPFWGIFERLSANAIHLAMSLFLLFSPWMVLLTAVLHSAINLVFTRVIRRSMSVAQVALAALAGLLLVLSLYLAR